MIQLLLIVYMSMMSNTHVEMKQYYPPTSYYCYLNTLRPKQNGRHFADDSIFFIEKIWILNRKKSFKFIPKGPVNNNLVPN